MKNWDDLRYFLAVARAGSVSTAAMQLGVNQSTVSRRVNAHEEFLGVRLFDRLPSGYQLTPEGEELLQYAERMEEESFAIERHVMGRNVALSGPIRVTAPLMLVKRLLIPQFKKFIKKHPEIELQLDVSHNIINLSKREIDVAIRVMRDMPSDNLIGRELGKLKLAVYGSKKYLNYYKKSKNLEPLRWVGEYNNEPRPNWLPEEYNNLALPFRANDAMVTIDAIKADMGVGRLPMIIGEADSCLQRIENSPVLLSGPLWILRHKGIRHVSRISAFVSFMSDEIRKTII